jgi:hypothetical protein
MTEGIPMTDPVARDRPDPSPDLDPRTLLGYLWDATGKNPGIRVRDLFADNDPLVEDVERVLAVLPPPAAPGLRDEVAEVVRQLARESLNVRDQAEARGWLMTPLPHEAEVRAALAETPGGEK